MSKTAESTLYIETSAALRAVLEQGTDPEVETAISRAGFLITSRLSLVEGARALLRARTQGRVTEGQIAVAEQNLEALWSHCVIWELSSEICAVAAQVAPHQPLRTLDALHVATFVTARRKFPGLQLLSCDERVQRALGVFAHG